MNEEMYFFIADISGYTAYMLKNQTDLAHGTIIVSELMASLVKQVRIPMEISKLEGDAVFLYLRKNKIPNEFLDDPLLLGKKILFLFQVFTNKLRTLQYSKVCACGACSHIEKLNLKMVAHYGLASINKIGAFRELTGVDVIIAHRLLKNQVQEKRYVLMTEAAYKHLAFPSEGKIVHSQEQDKDLGVIPIHIYYPPEIIIEEEEPSSLNKAIAHLKLIWGSLLLKLNLKDPLYKEDDLKK